MKGMLLNWHVHYDKYARRCVQVLCGGHAVLVLVDEAGNNLGFLGCWATQQEIDVSGNAKAVALAIKLAKKLDVSGRCFHQCLDYRHKHT